MLEQVRGLRVDLERILSKQFDIEAISHDLSVYQTTTDCACVSDHAHPSYISRTSAPRHSRSGIRVHPILGCEGVLSGCMSTQIAVRLPDEMVAFLDRIVASGEAPSRAALVATALEREMRRLAAEHDAQLLRKNGADR